MNTAAASRHQKLTDYRPDIDGLRAVAVIAVVLYHGWPNYLPGGFIGVDIFFVISGYLITSIILSALEQDRFSILEFYARRVRRIFPALLLVLVATIGFGWIVLLADEFKQVARHVSAGGLFVSNLLLWNEAGYFDNAGLTKPLLHLWSLGIEEQFYLLWPLMLWLMVKYRTGVLVLLCTVFCRLLHGQPGAHVERRNGRFLLSGDTLLGIDDRWHRSLSASAFPRLVRPLGAVGLDRRCAVAGRGLCLHRHARRIPGLVGAAPGWWNIPADHGWSSHSHQP